MMLLLDRFLKHFPLSIALVTQLYQLVDGYGFHAPLDDLTSGVSPPLRALSKRDGPELCSSSSPCRDKRYNRHYSDFLYPLLTPPVVAVALKATAATGLLTAVSVAYRIATRRRCVVTIVLVAPASVV